MLSSEKYSVTTTSMASPESHRNGSNFKSERKGGITALYKTKANRTRLNAKENENEYSKYD